MRILRAMDQCGWSPFTTPEPERRFTDPLDTGGNNRRSDRADFTDQDHRQLRHLAGAGEPHYRSGDSAGGHRQRRPYVQRRRLSQRFFWARSRPAPRSAAPTAFSHQHRRFHRGAQRRLPGSSRDRKPATPERTPRPSPADRAAAEGSSTQKSRSTPRTPASPPCLGGSARRHRRR